MASESLQERLTCIYCDAFFTTKSGLRQHTRLKHADVQIRCDHFHCPTYFRTPEEKRQHGLAEHVVHVGCPYCDKVVKNLGQHIRNIHPEKLSFKCPFKNCRGYFGSDAEKDAHLEREHQSNWEKRKRCQFCTYTTLRSHNLERHMNNKHLELRISDYVNELRQKYSTQL